MTFHCSGCNGIVWPWRKRVTRHVPYYHMDDGSRYYDEKEYHQACWEEYETRQAMALMSELVEPAPSVGPYFDQHAQLRSRFKWF